MPRALKLKPKTPAEFSVGDLVWHDRANPEDIADSDAGEVYRVHPCSIRVRTYDGRRLRWSRDRVSNMDQ